MLGVVIWGHKETRINKGGDALLCFLKILRVYLVCFASASRQYEKIVKFLSESCVEKNKI
jgi:hypothetical protein